MNYKGVLIIEDNKITSDMFVKFFQGLNLKRIDVNISVNEAIYSILKGNEYDLVILDYILFGDLTGVDFVEYLHQNKIPMCFVVHSSAIQTAEKQFIKYFGSEILTFEFLAKPSLFEHIENTIERVLLRHKIKIKKYNEKIRFANEFDKTFNELEQGREDLNGMIDEIYDKLNPGPDED